MTRDELIEAGARAIAEQYTPIADIENRLREDVGVVIDAVEALIRADEARAADAERDLAVADRERFDDERLIWRLRAQQAEQQVAELRAQMDEVGR